MPKGKATPLALTAEERAELVRLLLVGPAQLRWGEEARPKTLAR